MLAAISNWRGSQAMSEFTKGYPILLNLQDRQVAVAGGYGGHTQAAGRQQTSASLSINARAISLAIGYSFRRPTLWTIYPDLLES